MSVLNKLALRILIPIVLGLLVSMVFTTVVYEPDNHIGVFYAGPEDDLTTDISDETPENENSEPGITDEIETTVTPESISTRGATLEWVYTAERRGNIIPRSGRS